MSGIDDIAAERKRHVEEEGWTAKHDDRHSLGEMARAAAVYAYAATLSDEECSFHRDRLYGCIRGCFSIIAHLWPWDAHWFKPGARRRMLVKAGALIVAEIDRLDRSAAKTAAESARIAKAC